MGDGIGQFNEAPLVEEKHESSMRLPSFSTVNPRRVDPAGAPCSARARAPHLLHPSLNESRAPVRQGLPRPLPVSTHQHARADRAHTLNHTCS